MLKVLYLTVPSFFDLEISLIRELSKLVDIHVLMIVQPESMKRAAFAIDELDSRCSIIPSAEYKGMEKYSDMIDFKNWSIANNPDNSISSCIFLARQIASFYKKGGFDVLHSTTDCKTALMLMPFAYWHKHMLYTEHDPISHKHLSYIKDLLCYSLMFKSYKNLLLLSDSLLEPFCKKYKYDKKFIHFSKLSVYDFLTIYPDGKNNYGDYILFFGRIDKYKGVDHLIEAYLNSSLSQKDVKLVIAGKGNIEHNQNEFDNNIIFINRYIENNELAGLIRHCKFVVLPYLSATQSGCVMSAFAFNKPILATKVGDLPKVVIDDLTGFVVPPSDNQALTYGLEKMVNSDLNQLSLNISKLYQEGGELSWTVAVRQIYDAYRKILTR